MDGLEEGMTEDLLLGVVVKILNDRAQALPTE